MPEIKKDCYWYLIKRPSQRTGCALLSDFQCTKCDGKCSFYETEESFMKRQQEHQERIKKVPPSKQILWEEKGYKLFKSIGDGKTRGMR